MKIYFVRHGHPDYKNDCLTELGHRQAEAVAQRLRDSKIERIFASSMGRAYQTAEHTAKVLGLDVTPCDFIREIRWDSVGSEELPAGGHPWLLSDLRAAEGESIFMRDWQGCYPYSHCRVVEAYDRVATGTDAWLLELGYKREGDYYRVIGEDTDKTVAMFSHGGSSSAALAHILNIPFPQFCGMCHPDFTSVTVLEFSDGAGKLIYPKLMSYDNYHIKGTEAKNILNN